MYNDTAIEAQIAQAMPMATRLQLHVLPAHQELIAPLPTGYVGPVMADANQWLKQHGYRTLGPWMISWAPNGQPQLRRPVSGALRAVRDKTFQTVEVPEQLLIAVPFVGWPILPHNFTGPVTSVGLDITGPPLLLALTNDPPTIAWVPVVPRGTRGLYPKSKTKLGLQPRMPKPGRRINLQQAWLAALLQVGRVVTITSFGFIGLMSFIMLIGVLENGIQLLSIDSVIILFLQGFLTFIYSPVILGSLLVLLVILGLVKMSAMGNWNRFWNNQPAPPELLLDSRGEGNVGAWLS